MKKEEGGHMMNQSLQIYDKKIPKFPWGLWIIFPYFYSDGQLTLKLPSSLKG